MGEYDAYKPSDDLGGTGDSMGGQGYPGSLGALDHLGYDKDFGALGLGYPGDLGPAYPGGFRDEPSMAGEHHHAFGWKWLESEWRDMRPWWRRLFNLRGPAAVPAAHAAMGFEWPWTRAEEEARRRRPHHRPESPYVAPPAYPGYGAYGAPPPPAPPAYDAGSMGPQGAGPAGAVWVAGYGWMYPAGM